MTNIELSLFSLLILVVIIVIIIVTCFRRCNRRNHSTVITYIPPKDNDTVSCPEDLQNECAICLEQFNAGDAIKIMDCGHYYHQECIDEWLEKGGDCAKCSGENIV